MKILTVIPAYGRDYKTALSVEDDWLAGKDFKIPDGPYVSISEVDILKADGYTHICIRYNRFKKSSFFFHFSFSL